MKKNIITTAATAVVLLASVSSYADTATDTQNVNITVPEVVLIDVADADVNFICKLATHTDNIAGENFECSADGISAAPVTSQYDITANIVSNGATSRSLTVQAGSLIDPSWKLVANVTPPAASGVTVADVQITNASASNVVTGIKNAAQSAVAISYTLGPANANEAMAFSGTDGTTADTVVLTYTLGDDV